jgi:2-C-methyl-D-erythritol 4-phosphate cytidylyltransferase / 2-C-methyl-D-erythritol 2,4-cyclodiphosphate synthase
VFVSAIIAAGGRGARFGGDTPKQLLTLGGLPILQRTIDVFVGSPSVNELVVALPREVVDSPPLYLRGLAKTTQLVAGGNRRQDSVANAFQHIFDRADIVVIHDAARPFVTDAIIRRTVEAASESGAAIAAVPAHDTVKRADASGVIVGTLPREEIYLAQTPQAFRVDVLRAALALGGDATDEAALVERAGHRVRLVPGAAANLKITTPADLTVAERLLGTGGTAAAVFRIGNGYDLHRLVHGRPLILGGVTIPFDKGLQGHSDADVVCHAITDAILGAAGAGDIGRHFPDTDPAWKDADSIELLRRAAAVVRAHGYEIGNVDAIVVAEKPKIAPHVPAMIANVAAVLDIDASAISIKGKTNEGVDSIGAGESIAVHAVALVTRR